MHIWEVCPKDFSSGALSHLTSYVPSISPLISQPRITSKERPERLASLHFYIFIIFINYFYNQHQKSM